MTVPDKNENARLHIWVSGRVQGVGFRAFVQQRAARLELTGWVRNMGEDQVEAVAEGPRAKLELFADEVKAGPSAAHVNEHRLEWEPATGEFPFFNVYRSMW
jgi:acylphosphatase